jgi:phosphoribosylformylglycinamidine cyclo-ligase
VLSRSGAFASLFVAGFPGYREPVLALKTEEPGSKQLLAARAGRYDGIARDLVNHLVNDIAVMGAEPLAVLDMIVCSRLQADTVHRIIVELAAACREQACSLVGGETSEQPGVVADGAYVLSASMVGVVERERIVDGTAIAAGDVVLAVASNGLHTNGYTLVRVLLERDAGLADRNVDGEPFLQAALRPHRSYRGLCLALRDLPVHGMAHVTGGGVRDNLARILPEGTCADLDLGAFVIPSIFAALRESGEIDDWEMLRVFNLGVGLVTVVPAALEQEAVACAAAAGDAAYRIGTIVRTDGEGRSVRFGGRLRWR